MRTFPSWILIALALGSAPLAASPEGVVAPLGGLRLVHVATAQNTFGGETYLIHPEITGKAGAILLVTQRYGAPGVAGVYNDHPIGVLWDDKSGHWKIRNQDGTNVPLGAAFDLLVTSLHANATFHFTSVGNTESNYSDISTSFASGDVDLRVWITYSDIVGGVAHDHQTGVWRNGVAWSIFNEDEETMALSRVFNVAIGPPGEHSIVHVATAENSQDNRTYIDHPDLNGNPGAWLLTTHNWTPPSDGSSVYVDLATGVWYDPKASRWTIFDQAGGLFGAIPEGAAFNVLIDPNPSLFVDDFDSGSWCFWSSVTGEIPCK